MFGKNQVASPFNVGGDKLTVHDVWYTIQGEGPDAGVPAVFVRLSRCNLRCFFCDTDFSEERTIDTTDLVAEVRRASNRYLQDPSHRNPNLVVITGGEPLLQDIIPLVQQLNAVGYRVSVETAGTLCPDGLDLWFAPDRWIHGNLIVCSPKTPKIHPKIIPLMGALKYPVRAGECGDLIGLPLMSTQVRGRSMKLYGAEFTSAPSHCQIYLQPVEEYDDRGEVDKAASHRNVEYAAQLCMKHGYRLSLQMHKIVGLD